MIVTIDGPAGSGKSTAARKLAARLELPYLDTGAMYRAIAYGAQCRGVDFQDEQELLEFAVSMQLDLDCGPTHTRVRANGHDVSEAIRSLSVSAVTPYVAKCQGIRAVLVARQQETGAKLGSFVTEGRDQGSVVFPLADVKFVLEASIEKRADRRFQELQADGEDVEIKEVMQDLAARDAVDAKHWEPLLLPGKAILIDTTNLTIAQLIDRMADHVGDISIGG
jgi:cytidylate kinase